MNASRLELARPRLRGFAARLGCLPMLGWFELHDFAEFKLLGFAVTFALEPPENISKVLDFNLGNRKVYCAKDHHQQCFAT